jgi:cytochrome c biogenesis protein CcmG/thiol:disulfide interchange protein DsbE
MATTQTVSPRARRIGGVGAVFVAVAVLVIVRALLGSGSAGVAAVSAGQPVVGQVPPQFSGTALDGSHFDLSAERGRVVVLNFFATWCDNCRAELPLLQQLHTQRHPAGVDVVTVDFNDSGDARGFLAPYGIGFPALLDPGSKVGHAYLLSGLPVTFFIGRDGRVAHVFHGQLSDATLAESLSGLV